jgi:predicted alpha/beta superfamily hydrolase
MKKIFLFLLLVPLASSTAAQEKDQAIKIGEKFTFHSRILNEDRPYWVYLPESYNSKTQAPEAYPVLYLLDGDALFHSVTGVVQFMSRDGNVQIPELIVVAVPNTNRNRDLTPTHSLRNQMGKESGSLTSSGGGDAFLRFLQEELVPKIEANYRTLPYRILVGHSLGGLLAIHALLTAPMTFQGIIAIDPSLWWDNQVMVNRAKTFLAGARALRNAVFISLANTPQIGTFNNPKLNEETIKTFARLLEMNSPTSLRSKLQYFEAEDHGSVPLLSLYDGLLFIFEGYRPVWAMFLEPTANITSHFKKVSERLGADLLPPEQLTNSMGYALLYELREVDKAIGLFKLNVSLYPNSFNAYNSLAESYLVKGDKPLAVKNYEKALELNPENQKAKDQLQKLKN